MAHTRRCGHQRVARVIALLLAVLLPAGAAAAAGPLLTTESGITLRLLDERPVVRVGPSGFTLEVRAELTNGSGKAVYVLPALGAERDDLSVEMNGERQICGHHFLWWSWDCFTYCNLPSDPQYLTPICEEDPEICCMALRIVPNSGPPAPTPPPATDDPPAEIVLGFAVTADLDRIGVALGVDPTVVRLGSPPMAPREIWHLLLRIPVVLGESDDGLPSLAITLADDAGFDVQELPIEIRPPCVGDCDGDGTVTVSELVTMVNMGLDAQAPSSCAAGDADVDGAIGIAEIVAAVNRLLHGC